jgi:hypothetical protein
MGVYTDEGASKRNRIITYVVLGGIFLILAVVALFTFGAAQDSRAARDKATQLQQAFVAAGLHEPNVDQVVNYLGTDGGLVCDLGKGGSEGALAQAQLQSALANGAGGPGTRPVIATDQAVAGLQQIIKVYCPEKMNGFVSFINGLHLVETEKSS